MRVAKGRRWPRKAIISRFDSCPALPPMPNLQLPQLHKKYDMLQKEYGAKSLSAIYGAGKTSRPKVMFVFMNPTAKNISAHQSWAGLRAPWLGTKNIWKLFNQVGIISDNLFQKVQTLKYTEWSPEFSESLYVHIAKMGAWITNLAKCTQPDARPLPNNVFKTYRDLMLKEVTIIQPRHIITFGNQVSSVLLLKNVPVSTYSQSQNDVLLVNNQHFAIYPTYYPVGQGQRNMAKTVTRINAILSQK